MFYYRVFGTDSYECPQMLHYLVNGVMQANIVWKRGIVKYVKTRYIIYATGNIYLCASLYGLKFKMITMPPAKIWKKLINTAIQMFYLYYSMLYIKIDFHKGFFYS